MSTPVIDVLDDVLESARLGELDAIAYIVVYEDGSCDYGHSPLTEEECNKIMAQMYELEKSLQPQLDS